MKERTVYTAGVNGLSFLPKKHPNALHNSKITKKCFKRIVKVVRCGFYFLYIKFCTFHSLTHTQSYWEMCPRWIGLMSFYLVYWWDWKIRILLSLQRWDIFLLPSIKHTRIWKLFLYHWFISTYWVLNLYCSKKLPWWHSRNM